MKTFPRKWPIKRESVIWRRQEVIPRRENIYEGTQVEEKELAVLV